MKHLKFSAFLLSISLIFAGCSKTPPSPTTPPDTQPVTQAPAEDGITDITLADSEILVEGAAASNDPADVVYTANDIIYYEAGKDFTYGEGTEEDAHSPDQAAAHKVVHITKAGQYRLSGKLSLGQIAVDLGEDAKSDPEAVVTLILDGVDITCQVAPAVIFYNVYECGDSDNPAKDVDTTKAGANVILADGSKNNISGAYVARIYKPDSVVLNAEGTAVEDSKKLHKYDGAFYSKMSMNISGDTGVLNIQATNEGLDSEMHLTINGGHINISSGNDGINTNEDGVSVTTVNGGTLNIQVTGETGEGDGIDSNGYLVINGGTVIAAACSNSADAGIDSDMGIHITGGTVIASGSMLDRIEDGGQTYAVFNFAQRQKDTIILKEEGGTALLEVSPKNDYSILIYSSPELKEGSYTLWNGNTQLAGQSGMVGMGGRPGGMEPPGGERPDDFTPPRQDFPEGQQPPQKPGRPQDGVFQPYPGGNQEQTAEFFITAGANTFSNISALK